MTPMNHGNRHSWQNKAMLHQMVALVSVSVSVSVSA